jgi:hypothetical protein
MKTPKWNYTGDVNMLDYGGKNWRCVGNRQYQFVELINMDEACGRDNEGQPKYNVSLRLVDLNTVSAGNVKSALDCCGQEAKSGLADDIIAECLDSYGCHAPLEQYNGNNARALMRQAYQAANDLLDPEQLETALSKPVNKLGSTAREFAQGDFTSAMQRGCEAGSPDARIMAKIHGIPQSAIDDTRPADFLPYLMGYMCAMNGGTKETGEDISPEYFRGFERGENVKAGKCPAPGWIKQH